MHFDLEIVTQPVIWGIIKNWKWWIAQTDTKCHQKYLKALKILHKQTLFQTCLIYQIADERE